MDPFSLQGAAAATWGRVPSAPSSDLVSVLRQGRMVAGEVLHTFAGGTLLVSVGPHRVPATTSSALEPGRRYLFEIVDGDGQVELKAIAGQAGGDGALLATLRAALGAEQPIGALLEALQRELERGSQGSERHRQARERLQRGIAAQLYSPLGGANELAERLRHGGQSCEAQWLRIAFASSPGRAGELGQRLCDALLDDWLAGEPTTSFASELSASLRAVVAAAAPGLGADGAAELWLSGARVGDLPRGLGPLLERALARLPRSLVRDELLSDLRAFELDTLPQPLRAQLSRALLGLAAARAPGPEEGRLAILMQGADLKTQLVAALAELDLGATRDLVARTLESLEAEQWINVVRHAAHEPSHWSVPVFDGERWATAHLFVHREAFRAAELAVGAPVSRRFALAIELDRTGPVRVEILLGERALSLRVLAADERAATHLERRLTALEQRLAKAGREVHVALALASESALRAQESVHGLKCLSDRNVMDLRG